MIVDSYTYYTFLNMLGDDVDVKIMNQERNQNTNQKLTEIKGNLDDDEWMFQKASIIRAIKTMGRPASVY